MLAVRVSTLVVVAGLVPNDAVIPDVLKPSGRLDAVSVTLPVNPVARVIVMVVEAPAP